MQIGASFFVFSCAIVMTLRRCGREVEGTPLLREHAAYTRIEGSNPSISARIQYKEVLKPA